MWRALLLLLLLAVARGLLVNELMSKNTHTIEDNFGDYPDWIEVYNDLETEINLSEYRMTSNLSDPQVYAFPNITLGPSAFYLVWAVSPENVRGPDYAPFSLSRSDGGVLALFSHHGYTVSDVTYFGELSADQTFGRYPDGAPRSNVLTDPTPRAENVLVETPETARKSARHETYWAEHPPYYPGQVVDFNVHVTEEDFRVVTDDGDDIEVTVSIDGSAALYPAEMKRHGSSSAEFPKKSYRLKFDDDFEEPLPDLVMSGQAIPLRHIVLKSMFQDPLFFREKLVMDVILTMGGLASHTGFARLLINGEYHGLYMTFERIDARFLSYRGWNKNGNLYKATREFRDEPLGLFEYPVYKANLKAKSDYMLGYEKKRNEDGPSDDLNVLLDTLTDTPARFSRFEQSVAPYFNLTDFTIYQKAHVWSAERDAYYHNYYLYHDPSKDSPFRLITWDAVAVFGFLGGHFDRSYVEGARLYGRDYFSPRWFSISEYRESYMDDLLAEVSSGCMSNAAVDAAAQTHLDLYQTLIEEDNARWPRTDKWVDDWIRKGSIPNRMADMIDVIEERNEAVVQSINQYNEVLRPEVELYVAATFLLLAMLCAGWALTRKGLHMASRMVAAKQRGPVHCREQSTGDEKGCDLALTPVASDFCAKESRDVPPRTIQDRIIAFWTDEHQVGIAVGVYSALWAIGVCVCLFVYLSCEFDTHWRPGEGYFILSMMVFPVCATFLCAYVSYRLRYVWFSRSLLSITAVLGLVLAVLTTYSMVSVNIERGASATYGGGRCGPDGADNAAVGFVCVAAGFVVSAILVLGGTLCARAFVFLVRKCRHPPVEADHGREEYEQLNHPPRENSGGDTPYGPL